MLVTDRHPMVLERPSRHPHWRTRMARLLAVVIERRGIILNSAKNGLDKEPTPNPVLVSQSSRQDHPGRL